MASGIGGFFQNVYGSRPVVPTLTPLDLQTEQGAAIRGNQAALPGAESLVGSANRFNIDQINSMLENVMPGFQGMASTASGDISSMLKGEIPADVSAAVQNSAAARSLGTGTAGSGMGRDLVARDLGLTSLDLTNKGITSMEGWMKTAASIYEPNMLNVSSMFVTPGQQAAFDTEERNTQFGQQWLSNQVAAMPNPVAAGITNTVMSLISSIRGGGSGPGINTATPGGGPGGNYDTTSSDGGGVGGFNTMDSYNPGMNFNINTGGGDMSGMGGMTGDFGAWFGAGMGGFA